MSLKHVFNLGSALLVAGALVSPSVAHATLGESLPKASAEVVPQQVAGQTLQTRQRGMVKEFADADGKVFAAVWRGTGAPNLMGLLGPYADAYREGMRTRTRMGHNLVVFTTPEMSVAISSHGRLMQGHVILTKHVPVGVTIDALK